MFNYKVHSIELPLEAFLESTLGVDDHTAEGLVRSATAQV